MASTRSVSIELLGNYVVRALNGSTGAGDDPSTAGLYDGGFVTAIEDADIGGTTVQFSDSTGTSTPRVAFAGSDPSIARLNSDRGSVAVVSTSSSGQLLLTRLNADNEFHQFTVGAGSNADIATDDGGIAGYAVAYERAGGGITLAIAASDDATSLTHVDLPNTTAFDTDPSVARLANGNYVVAWSGIGNHLYYYPYYMVVDSVGRVVVPPTSAEVTSLNVTSVHPSVTASGNDFAISFEDVDDLTGELNIATYTRSADGGTVTTRQYEAPAGSQDRDPDAATVGTLHLTAFTSNYMDGDDIRVQDLNLGISEAGTGTVLTDAENLVHIAGDGSQASIAAIAGGNTGRFLVSYYDRNGGEVRQQLARVRETITGDASNQTLEGKYGVALTIDGAGGDDDLSDGDGDDKLFGNTGNDVLHSKGSYYAQYSGDDLFDGGDGVDTLDYRTFYTSITASLAITGPQNTGAGTDTILRIENLTGSRFFADRLTGNSGANVLDDGGIDFNAANIHKDTLNGGLGNDTYIVSDRVDVVIESSASGGTDLVKSRANSFVLPVNVEQVAFIGAGNFTGTGNAGNNRFTGGAGDDKFIGDGAGVDIFGGSTGTDSVFYTKATSGVAINLATGSHGGVAAGDIFGSIEKFFGSDTANDAMTAGSGRAVFSGQGGNDKLTGADNIDYLLGGAGNDTLKGGGAIDQLQGGLDNDVLDGGTGQDLFLYIEPKFGRDIIQNFEDGQDRLKVFSTVADAISDFTITGNRSSHVVLTLKADTTNTLTLDGKAGAPITITADDFLFY